MSEGFSFSIETPKDFLEKLKQEYQEYADSPLSSRHALNLAMTGFHMIEWIWGGELKKNIALKNALGINDLTEFTDLVFQECPSLKILRAIANGSKHFRTEKTTVKKTSQEGGWDNSGWDETPWDYGYLKIELANGQIASFGDEAKSVVEYWDDFFKKHLPLTSGSS